MHQIPGSNGRNLAYLKVVWRGRSRGLGAGKQSTGVTGHCSLPCSGPPTVGMIHTSLPPTPPLLIILQHISIFTLRLIFRRLSSAACVRPTSPISSPTSGAVASAKYMSIIGGLIDP